MKIVQMPIEKPSRSRSALSIPLVLSLLVTANGCGQLRDARAIDQLLGEFHQQGQFNGVAFVAENSKVIYSRAFGQADFELGIPNEVDTRFGIGSITKQFTSLLVLMLVDEGTLSLTGTVTDYVPHYPGYLGDEITIHHLLTHTSGIPDWKDLELAEPLNHPPSCSPDQIMMLFTDAQPRFEPGTEFLYSNLGYMLLGAIIESVTQSLYEDVLRAKVLAPLGMTDTGFEHANSRSVHNTIGYERVGTRLVGAQPVAGRCYFSDAGLHSTVEDLFRWSRALDSASLLSPAFYDLLFTPHVNVRDGGYGYGWFFGHVSYDEGYADIPIMEHSGAVPGFNCSITKATSDDKLIVLLTNAGHTNLTEIRDAILGVFNDRDTGTASERPPNAEDGETEVLPGTALSKGDAPAHGDYTFPLEIVWETDPENQPLGEIGGLAPLLGGVVWVQDIEEGLFFVLGSDGTTIRTVGPSGNAPGVIADVNRASLHAVGDTVVIVDDGTLHYFSALGTHLESLSPESRSCETLQDRPVAVTFLSRYEYAWAPLVSLPASNHPTVVSYCHLKNRTQHRIDEVPGLEVTTSQTESNALAIIYPPITPCMALGSDATRVFFGKSNKYLITEWNSRIGIRGAFGINRDRQRVSEADKQRVVAKWARLAPEAMLNDLKEGLPGWTTHFDRIEVHDEWIFVYASHLFRENVQQIDIFSRDGVYQYRAWLSVDETIRIVHIAFSGEHVYMALEHGEGTVTITKFRTALPPHAT